MSPIWGEGSSRWLMDGSGGVEATPFGPVGHPVDASEDTPCPSRHVVEDVPSTSERGVVSVTPLGISRGDVGDTPSIWS